jgi:hypothetical protein
LCFLPLAKTGRTAATRAKNIPGVATQALPMLSAIRRPAAFGAAHMIFPFLHVKSNLKVVLAVFGYHTEACAPLIYFVRKGIPFVPIFQEILDSFKERHHLSRER